MDIDYFKIPFETSKFNINQKVFILSLSGNCSAYVRGKYRGKNRYITCWVNWSAKNKPAPKIRKMNVDYDFYKRIKGE